MKRNHEMVRINRPAAPTIAYSVSQLTAVIPICRTTIYEEIKAGRLRPTKIGRRTVFPTAEVERWLEERAAATRGAAK